MNTACFCFGHRHMPAELSAALADAICTVHKAGARTFIVGNYGDFDRACTAALRAFAAGHPDVTLLRLTPWHPSIRPCEVPKGFNGTFYPPIESVPKRYCIVRANEYMIQTCDYILCYVAHPGNSRNLLNHANGKKLFIHNIAEAQKI